MPMQIAAVSTSSSCTKDKHKQQQQQGQAAAVTASTASTSSSSQYKQQAQTAAASKSSSIKHKSQQQKQAAVTSASSSSKDEQQQQTSNRGYIHVSQLQHLQPAALELLITLTHDNPAHKVVDSLTDDTSVVDNAPESQQRIENCHEQHLQINNQCGASSFPNLSWICVAMTEICTFKVCLTFFVFFFLLEIRIACVCFDQFTSNLEDNIAIYSKVLYKSD